MTCEIRDASGTRIAEADLLDALPLSRRSGHGATVWLNDTLLATTGRAWFDGAWIDRADSRTVAWL